MEGKMSTEEVATISGVNSTATTVPVITYQGYTPGVKVGFITAYIIIFIVALFGNSIGLFVVWKKATSKRATDILISNLAIADLIITLTIMPYSVVYMYFEANRWFGGTLGLITCKVVFWSIPVSIAASVITMMIISFDRYFAVFFPVRQFLVHKQKAVTTVIWLSSLVSMTPNLFLYQVFKEGDHSYCYQNWPWSNTLEETFFALKIFHVIMFIILYPVPLLIITVTNVLIGYRLLSHRIPGSTSSATGPSGRNMGRNVLRMFTIIVLAFAFCWFPTYLSHYFMYFKPNFWHKIPLLWRHLSFWVSHSNSAINPLLYIVLNKNFRSAFWETIHDGFSILLHAPSACSTNRRNRVDQEEGPPCPEPHPISPTSVGRLGQFSPCRVAPENTNKENFQDTKL